MEEKIVILSKLTVKKLYGNYDYDVKFNADVTLLYGTNGCGKTTILNIITSIITGSIYKLFSYKFEKIVLNYYDERDNKIKKRVSLIKKIEDNIEIDFQEQMQNIIKIQMPEERRHRVDSLDALYLEEYPVLKEMRVSQSLCKPSN
jgi:predicted ATP-binding protein involved in virulence